jgi:malic enzyme
MIKISPQEALDYHQFPTRGKISITPTKPFVTQHDLSLADTPGVAQFSPAMEYYNRSLSFRLGI